VEEIFHGFICDKRTSVVIIRRQLW